MSGLDGIRIAPHLKPVAVLTIERSQTCDMSQELCDGLPVCDGLLAGYVVFALSPKSKGNWARLVAPEPVKACSQHLMHAILTVQRHGR